MGCPRQGCCREAAAKSRRWWDSFCSLAPVAARLERGGRAKRGYFSFRSLCCGRGFLSRVYLPLPFARLLLDLEAELENTIEKGSSDGVVGRWKEKHRLICIWVLVANWWPFLSWRLGFSIYKTGWSFLSRVLYTVLERTKLDTGYERRWLIVNHSTNLRDYCNSILAIAVLCRALLNLNSCYSKGF